MHEYKYISNSPTTSLQGEYWTAKPLSQKKSLRNPKHQMWLRNFRLQIVFQISCFYQSRYRSPKIQKILFSRIQLYETLNYKSFSKFRLRKWRVRNWLGSPVVRASLYKSNFSRNSKSIFGSENRFQTGRVFTAGPIFDLGLSLLGILGSGKNLFYSKKIIYQGVLL